jgi:uncharacterized protein (DUF302 family)
MSLMDAMMKKMIRVMKKEKREQMMIDMMPLMMEGLDINELMPKMAANMLKDLTADDLVNFFKESLKDKEMFKRMGEKMLEANLVQQMITKTYKSKLNFDDTVAYMNENAPKHGWTIPDIRDLQAEYREAGHTDMTKVKILYFCNSKGGYSILKNDHHKALSVMMPLGVSVYETSGGCVKIAAMNIKMMAGMFGSTVKEVLEEGAQNLENVLQEIIE